LVTAVAALVTVLGLKEPRVRVRHVAPETNDPAGPERTAWHLLSGAAAWIVRTPLALFVITAGLMLDSVVRLFLTFSSSYFRLIEIPAVAFGGIGAVMGLIGFAASPLARRMVKDGTVLRNYVLLAGIVFVSLVGVSLQWRYWGVLFIVPLTGGMMALGYMISYYLNALVDARHRATVLSFKGVAFNLGYGFISLLFALVLKSVQAGTGADAAFAHALLFLPVWVLGAALIGGVFVARHARLVRVRV
jgi:hypothetical protein